MKALLIAINASYSHTNLAVRYLSKSANCPFYETNINQPSGIILKNILQNDAEFYCFSCYIWNIEIVLKLAEDIKKIKPESCIVLGGPEVSFNAKELLTSHKFLDYILCGEGERMFPDFLNNPEARIPGVVSRQAGDDSFQIVCDFSSVPYPYETLPENQIIYYEMSRGCPFSCTYCLSGAMGGGVRRLPMQRIQSDLIKLSKANVKVIKLVDRTFNADKKFVKQILPFIIEQTGEVRFHFEIGADLLDDEIIEILNSAPVNKFQLEAGVQTCNNTTLELVKRKTDLEKLAKNITALITENKMHIHLDLIAGLPEEDLESFAHSFDFVYKLKPHMLQLGFLKLLYGSELRENARQHGIVFSEYPPYEVLFTKDITFEELNLLRNIDKLVDRLYNSGHFSNTLEYLAGQFDSAFEMYSLMAKFAQKSLDFSMSIARQAELLFDFGKNYGDGLRILALIKLDFLQNSIKGNRPKCFEEIDLNISKKQIFEQFKLEPTIKFEVLPINPINGERRLTLLIIGDQVDLVSEKRLIEIK